MPSRKPRWRPAAQTVLVAGLVMSTGYLAWSMLAKSMVDREATRVLAAAGMADAPRFSVPTPFNTLLWRVVAMTPTGYLEGERSIFDGDSPMRFRQFESDKLAETVARGLPSAQRMAWFNRGFQRARIYGDGLVLTDLRMGSEPDYFFNYTVARRDAMGQWQALDPSERFSLPDARPRTAQLGRVWGRIWKQSAPDNSPRARLQ